MLLTGLRVVISGASELAAAARDFASGGSGAAGSADRLQMAGRVETVRQRRVRRSAVEPRVVIAHDVGMIQRRQHLNLPRQSLPHLLADSTRPQQKLCKRKRICDGMNGCLFGHIFFRKENEAESGRENCGVVARPEGIVSW